MRISNLKRDLVARTQSLEALHQVKEAELKTLRGAQERQLKEQDDELAELSKQRAAAEEQQLALTARAGALESEKRKEVGQVQHEIKKLEEDIEGLRNRMKSKERDPQYAQVNEFFKEVQDYME